MNYSIDELLEKFGVTDEATGEMVVDKVALKKDLIKQGVGMLVQIESINEQFKDLLSYAKEEGFDKKEVSALIKHSYKNEIEQKIAELEDIQVKLNSLFGESED